MFTFPYPDLLLVHGALGSAAQLAPVAQAFTNTRAYRSVQTIELPGHGASPLAPGQGFDMPTFAEALADEIRARDVQRPLVFGYSMGGYVALLLAAQRPGLLAGIVTLGTMLHWTPDVAAGAVRRLDPAVLRVKVPAFAALLEARHAQAGGWEAVLGHTAALLNGLGASPPLTDAVLRTVPCPVHLLLGDRDDSVSLEDATRAATHLPHARASLLADTPHPIEQVPLEALVRAVGETAAVL